MDSGSVNQHDKRKNEIIDCAAQLFLKDNFEKTSIQKIIDTMGIAKGTFYYYFKSKMDLLNQFTLRESRKILKILDDIVARKDLNIIEKFNSYFETAVSWKVKNWDILIAYIKHSGQSENKILYETLLENNIKLALPSIILIVDEGIKEGYFKTDFPDLASEAIFRVGAAVTDQLRPLLLNSRTKEEGFHQFLRIMDFYQDTIEKILGADKGVFKIFDREKLLAAYQNSSDN